MVQLFDDIYKTLNTNNSKVSLYYLGKKIKANKLIKEIKIWSNILKYKFNINKGDVVTINLPNMPNAIILFYAINKCGAIADIIHPLNPINNIIEAMGNTHSKLLITLDSYFSENKNILKKLEVSYIVCRISDYLPHLKKCFMWYRESNIEKSLLYKNILKESKGVVFDNNNISDNIAVYLHSTGTTGEAKTVVLSNKAISELKNSLSNGVINDMNPNRNKSIMVLPLFHGFGFGVCMHAMLAYGFEIILMPKFDINKFANLVYKRKITICTGVPTMFSKLLKLTPNKFGKLKSLENIFVGGEKLDMDLKMKFDKRLKQIGSSAELIEGYGLSETVTVCCVNRRGERDSSSVGQPLNGIDIKIIDNKSNLLNNDNIGEICVGGPTIMEGYLNDENKNVFIEINGKQYIKTGDIGFLDKFGTLHFIERKKRVFKINGVNIFPSEIEKVVKMSSVMIEHCVVLFNKGNIFVFVQTQQTDYEHLKNEIINCCKNNLIKYAVPIANNIFFYKLFPKNNVGKIDIRAMQKDLEMISIK